MGSGDWWGVAAIGIHWVLGCFYTLQLSNTSTFAFSNHLPTEEICGVRISARVQDPGSRIQDPGSKSTEIGRIEDPGSKSRIRVSMKEDPKQDPKEDPGRWMRIQKRIQDPHRVESIFPKQDPGSKIQDPGSKIQDPGSRIREPGSRIQNKQ